MATLVNQPASRYERVPQWLRDLQFVTDFFSWLFALFSRLAEPLMLVSTLYLVGEAGVPAIAQPALHNLSLGLMITAPEIIMPGSFVTASRAQDHARLLFVVCWTFVLLTMVTLVSLFVWHFTGQSLAWLMCARCATAVGYSILMRVMHQHSQAVQSTQAQVVQSQAIDTRVEALAAQLQAVQSGIAHVVQSQVQAAQQSLLEQVTSQLAEAMQEVRRDLRSAIIAEATSARASEPAVTPAARQLRSIPALVQSEPVHIRVTRFIQARMEQEHKPPSLTEIMDACQCSRGSAIRYRRELLGESREEEEGVA